MSNMNEMAIGFEFEGFASDTPRWLVRDWLIENGRNTEAETLAKTQEILLSSLGKIIPKRLHLLIQDHPSTRRRVVRPGNEVVRYEFSKARRSNQPNAIQSIPGESFIAKDGVFVCTGYSSWEYITEDQIEDMDDWSTYPDGQGWYSFGCWVPVEPTEHEAGIIKSQQEKVDREAAEAKSSEELFRKIWDSVRDHEVHVQFDDLLSYRNIKGQMKGGVGEVWSLADFSGGYIVRREWAGCDDYRRNHYASPEVLEAIQEKNKEEEEKRTRIRSFHFQAKQEMGRLVEAGYPECILSIYTEPIVAAYAADNDKEGMIQEIKRVCEEMRIKHSMCLEIYTERHKQRLDASPNREAILEKYRNYMIGRYFNPDHDYLEEILDEEEKERKEKEKRSARAKEAAKRRKEDPLVEVIGNTYRHRDQLKLIPGSKLKKVNDSWVWKIPKSKANLLPIELSIEE